MNTSTAAPLGVPADSAVRFVTFLRRANGALRHCPMDFPIEELVGWTWQQVIDLWGGGEYQAITKDAHHRVLGHYPAHGQWVVLPGEPKLLVVPPRPPRPAPPPGPTDDPSKPILPPEALQIQPSRGGDIVAVAPPGPPAVPSAAPAAVVPVWIRDVELGERMEYPNPFDLRPAIARLLRQGVIPEAGVTGAPDGGYLLTREAAVLVAMRVKVKKGLRLDVVGALLATGLAPVPPAAPPIVMNGEGATVTFDGQSFPVYVFRGRPCIVASDLGRALGYADDGQRLVDSIRDKWRAEFRERDVEVLTGDDLRAFKALVALTPNSRVSGNTPNLTILYESGMDLACQKAQTEAGARLRRYLTDHVLPRLRRGEAVTVAATALTAPLIAAATSVPLVPAVATPSPIAPSPADVPKFHPVLVERLDETSQRLRNLEERVGRLEARPS